MAKSEFRCNLEHAVRSVPGCANITNASHVFVDRSKTHDRIKFAFTKCTGEQARDIETIVDDMYPDSEVKVMSTFHALSERHKDKPHNHYYMGWYGVAIYVSHDDNIRL